MVWLYRFLLGLPARNIDRQEVLINFPELIEGSEKLNELIFYEHLIFFRYNKTYEEFKIWINRPKQENAYDNCPQLNCLARKVHSNQTLGNEETFIYLMQIGGFTKPPKESFFDLVRKVHGYSQIKRVILTDPYILMEDAEDGTTGGLDNLREYLTTLGLESTSTFTLEISPSPKMYTEVRYNKFEKYLKTKFPKISIGRYKPKYEFHDRFYLVEDSSGNFKGVFGPSLNGLLSKAIVLYGEIEINPVMSKIGKWFE